MPDPQETSDAHPEERKAEADEQIEEVREDAGIEDDIAGGSPGESPDPQQPTPDQGN